MTPINLHELDVTLSRQCLNNEGRKSVTMVIVLKRFIGKRWLPFPIVSKEVVSSENSNHFTLFPYKSVVMEKVCIHVVQALHNSQKLTYNVVVLAIVVLLVVVEKSRARILN